MKSLRQTTLCQSTRPRIQTFIEQGLRETTRTIDQLQSESSRTVFNEEPYGLDRMTCQLLQSPRIRTSLDYPTSAFEDGRSRGTPTATCSPLSFSTLNPMESLQQIRKPIRLSYTPSNKVPDYVSKIRELTDQWSTVSQASNTPKNTVSERVKSSSSYQTQAQPNVGLKEIPYSGRNDKASELMSDIKDFIKKNEPWNTASPKNRQLKENYLDSYSFKKQKGENPKQFQIVLKKDTNKERKCFQTPKQQISLQYGITKIPERGCYTPHSRLSFQQYEPVPKENIRVSEFLNDKPGDEALEFIRGSLLGRGRPTAFKSAKNQFATKKLSIKNFEVGPCKGDGKFGKVYPCRSRQTKTLYALKEIPKHVIRKNNLQNQLVWQIKLQSFFNHPNIVKLYGFFDDSTNIYLLMEYMQGGTLFENLKKHKATGGLPQIEVSKRMKQICSAVYYMHDMEIAHRDIKPENIVLSNGVAKLCDFGWSTLASQRRTTYCGTFDYSSPEMLEGKEYDSSVDLWSLGVLAYELLTGKLPFYSISRKETMKNILSVDKSNITFPAQTSWEARSFIEGLLKKQPDERREAEMLLQHPFLKKYQQNFI